MSFLGITIGKKATAAKRAFKLERKKIKLEAKTERVSVRQDAHTERVATRQDAKTTRNEAKQDANSIAYANGVAPSDAGTSLMNLVGTGIKGVASFFGGGSGQQEQMGLTSGTPPYVYNSPKDGTSMDGLLDGVESSGVSPMLLIGGALLLLMLMKKK